MFAMSSSAYIALDFKWLPNSRRFNTTDNSVNPFVVTHRIELTFEYAIYWNETASLINERCNFKYCHELTPKPSILDAGDCLLLAGLPVPLTFFLYKRRTNSKHPTEGSPCIIIKRTELCLCSISAGPYYLQENIFFSIVMTMWVCICTIFEKKMAVVYYVGTQIPEIGEIDSKAKFEFRISRLAWRRSD